MTYYAIDTSKQARHEHAVLIGLPLVITMAFCFAFVLMQPHQPHHTITATANQPKSETTQSGLAALPMATFPQLTPITPGPVADNSSMNEILNTTLTTTPQADPAMGTSLQAANANDQPTTAILQPTSHHPKTTLSASGRSSRSKH